MCVWVSENVFALHFYCFCVVVAWITGCLFVVPLHNAQRIAIAMADVQLVDWYYVYATEKAKTRLVFGFWWGFSLVLVLVYCCFGFCLWVYAIQGYKITLWVVGTGGGGGTQLISCSAGDRSTVRWLWASATSARCCRLDGEMNTEAGQRQWAKQKRTSATAAAMAAANTASTSTAAAFLALLLLVFFVVVKGKLLQF